MPACPCVQFLYFDLGNVLLHFDPGRAARQLSDLCGVGAEALDGLIFQTDLAARYERGELNRVEFFDRICGQVGGRPPLEQMEIAASDIFSPNHPIIPLLSQLKACGHRLGLLSNTNESHWRHVTARYPSIVGLFEIYSLSFELGCMKPSEEIYRRAAARAGWDGAQIFFVDDRSENVAAARRAGWDAQVFQDVPRLATALRQRGLRFNY